MKRQDIQPIYTRRSQEKKSGTKVIVVGLLLLIILGIFFAKNIYQRNQLKNYPVRGVTLDQDNGYIDFDQLRDNGVKFVYLKATQGAAFSDDSFGSNYQRSQGALIPVGVYHYFSFSSSPKDQFNNFIQQVKYNTGSLPIMIQVQYYAGYDSENVKWKKTSGQIYQLVKLLINYYKRPVIISANQQIIKSIGIQKGKYLEYWFADGKPNQGNSGAAFISNNQSQRYILDHQSVSLPLVLFNGSTKKWHQYLDTMVDK